MNTNTIDKEKLSSDIENVIERIAMEGDGGGWYEKRVDFVDLAFREFVSSDFFSGMDRERKKRLIDSYYSLTMVLLELDDFVTKYTNLEELKVNVSFR